MNALLRKIPIRLEPRLNGFFEDVLKCVGFGAGELAFEGGSLQGGGEICTDAGADGGARHCRWDRCRRGCRGFRGGWWFRLKHEFLLDLGVDCGRLLEGFDERAAFVHAVPYPALRRFVPTSFDGVVLAGRRRMASGSNSRNS